MTDVLIKRELLERVVGEGAGTSLNAMRELRAILAAPPQPEGEGLEVVAYQSIDATRGGGWMAHKHALPQAHIDQGALQEPLCRLSDAQRAIAEMREECEAMAKNLRGKHATSGATYAHLIAERDTLRQQLAERDATIERLEAGIPRLQEQSFQMRHQRDKLAAALDELMYARTDKAETMAAAALAEVKPCQESPNPAAT